MKKLLIVVIVLAVIAAGLLGYLWYQTSHIFVEDAVYAKNATELDLRGTGVSLEHYLTVRSQLPDCDILWDVPFQGGVYANDTKILSMNGVGAEDIKMLPYFTELKTLNVSGCEDYVLLEELQVKFPNVTVHYTVDLGGLAVDRFTTELELQPGDYDYDILMENLVHLPDMQSITFLQTQMDAEKFDAIQTAYASITFGYTLDLLGMELTADATSLDLTKMTSADLDSVLAKLPLLASLESIELAPGNEAGGLTLEEAAKLKAAAPEAALKYTFELYGEVIDTDAESLYYKNKRKDITNDTISQLRMALEIMNNCTKVVLDNTAVSDETMAQLREDFRGKTDVVWRVWYGEGGTSLTDVEVLRIVYGLGDDNSKSLKYLENVRYMDLGHNEYLDYCDFVGSMTELEVVIISGAPIKSLEPFANCPKLKFLEMANCTYVPDLEPLRNCKELEMLNIAHTSISDLAPLDDIPLTHLCSKINKVTEEERERFIELHPDCWTTYKGDIDYGEGWRYDENGDKLEWYARLADAFGYPNPNNNTGWYLD